MNVLRVLVAGLCTLNAGAAVAQNGLVAPEDTPWPRWQWRAQWLGAPALGTTPLWRDAPAASGLRVVGDYYLFDLRTASGAFAGGLRATSALTVLRGVAPADGSGFSWPPHAVTARPGAELAAGTWPYVGVGFTGAWPRHGWGFTADVGLGSRGNGLRLNPAGNDGGGLDDVLRELRLSPVLQLGVTYAF